MTQTTQLNYIRTELEKIYSIGKNITLDVFEYELSIINDDQCQIALYIYLTYKHLEIIKNNAAILLILRLGIKQILKYIDYLTLERLGNPFHIIEELILPIINKSSEIIDEIRNQPITSRISNAHIIYSYINRKIIEDSNLDLDMKIKLGLLFDS